MNAQQNDPFAIFDEAPLQTRGDESKLDRLQVANGGTGNLTHPCPGCKGRGRFVSYTGRVVGNCFKCNGTGQATTRQVAAHKAVQTKKHNDAEWLHAHHKEVAYMQHRAQHSSFMASLASSFKAYGKLTDNQLAAVRKDMAEEPARIAAAVEKRNLANATKSGEVDLSRINDLFNTAKGNGLKKPKFRTEHVVISEAPAHGRNAGALYVTKGDAYLGKIVDGKYLATNEAPVATLSYLRQLADDPLAAGVAYGRLTGSCCACGRTLTDPVSVENGIGPICESNWGL